MPNVRKKTLKYVRDYVHKIWGLCRLFVAYYVVLCLIMQVKSVDFIIIYGCLCRIVSCGVL